MCKRKGKCQNANTGAQGRQPTISVLHSLETNGSISKKDQSSDHSKASQGLAHRTSNAGTLKGRNGGHHIQHGQRDLYNSSNDQGFLSRVSSIEIVEGSRTPDICQRGFGMTIGNGTPVEWEIVWESAPKSKYIVWSRIAFQQSYSEF